MNDNDEAVTLAMAPAMTPERWQQIEQVFYAALEREPNQRAAFLAEACAGEEILRQEVEALLAKAEAESSFDDLSALVATEVLAAEKAKTMVGRMLGHYRLLSHLGAGGMGEVWRAADTHLHREVAIKILPASYTTDPARLRRFEQEARAVGALNHPNILTVYDFGSHEGHPYLVMELLEGEELRAPLNNGALPVRKAIDYAQQIAAGLAAAHEKGIIHRDLKPENLFVTKDGRVRVLDFGLAKLRPLPNTPMGSDVATQKQLTNPGTVMGTVAYMSPEQVRGEVVDHRSDIFSFGLILYEMLRGEQAFRRETMAETMTAILKEDAPELSETNTKIAPQLEKLVRRCLEKRPERRFQSASDLGFALEALSTPSSSSGNNLTEAVRTLGAAAARHGVRRERLWMIVAGLAVLTALSLAYFKRSSADTRVVRMSFTPPADLTFDNGAEDYVRVSPDGQKLVFTGRSADGKKQLWVRSIDATEWQLLPGTDDPWNAFWSPDSRSLAFGSQGKLKRIELAGGRPQTLCDAPKLMGGAWSHTGVILFQPLSAELFQIPATGGEPKQVTNISTPHQNPCFLPDGRHFLYRAIGGEGRHKVLAGSLDSTEVKPVLDDGGPALYAPPSWLVFVRNGALLAQAFDAERLELKGETVPLTQATSISNNFAAGLSFSVSENGVLIWQGDRRRDYQLVWFDRAGKQDGTVGALEKVTIGQSPRLSPDGKRVAFFRSDPQVRNDDIWLVDLASNLPTRLLSDPALDQHPIWSPDGSRVGFTRASGGGAQGLYQKAVSEVGAEELLLQGKNIILADWSPDGRFILYNWQVAKTRGDIWALPLFGDRQP